MGYHYSLCKYYQSRDWLYEHYIEKRLPLWRLAELGECSPSTISRWMDRHSLPRRGQTELNIEYWQNPEFRTHQIKIRKEMAKDPQWRAMHSAITKRAWANPETRVKFLARAPSEFTADHRRKISKALTGRKFSEEHKRKISEAAQKRMQDPKERQRMQDMRAVAMNKRPTGPEVVYDEITPPIIRYVGNGQWWRNMPNGSKKNPDFKVTGQDKVIEIWGDYWHRNDSPKEEIDHYSEAGLRCLVFWEHEIYQQPDMVLIKTIDFLSA